ncbi:MAG: hypothetical protein H0X66_02895 [Verrucomicrobia bacterium]|nr:hypothetical protein [Verrucomicrobiota bacterium]
MTAIAVELDQKLQSLDPETAASVERLVRDALQLAEKVTRQATVESLLAPYVSLPFDDAAAPQITHSIAQHTWTAIAPISQRPL